MNVLVDFDFIVYLREKYAIMQYPSDEDLRILEYCEAIIQNHYVNRGLREAYKAGDINTYNGLKAYKLDSEWENDT